jgi:hypothetical protein
LPFSDRVVAEPSGTPRATRNPSSGYVEAPLSPLNDLTNNYQQVTFQNGKTYVNVRLMRIEGEELLFLHRTGIGRVPLSEVPQNIRGDIGRK